MRTDLQISSLRNRLLRTLVGSRILPYRLYRSFPKLLPGSDNIPRNIIHKQNIMLTLVICVGLDIVPDIILQVVRLSKANTASFLSLLRFDRNRPNHNIPFTLSHATARVLHNTCVVCVCRDERGRNSVIQLRYRLNRFRVSYHRPSLFPGYNATQVRDRPR